MDNTPIETGISQPGISTGIEGSGWYQSYKQYEDGPGLESPGFLGYLGQIGSGELKALSNDPLGYAGDLIAAPVRGAVDAAMGVYGLADWLTADLLPDWKENPLGTSHTAIGGLVQGISNFAVGFIPIAGWLGKAGTALKASKIGGIAKAGSFLEAGVLPAESLTTTGAKITHYLSKDIVGGAVTSAVVFRGDQERLSNLLTQIDNPALNNAVTQYLAADPKDGEIEGRFKNAIEGMIAGPVMDALLLGLKAIKAPRDIMAKGGSEAAALKARNGVVNSTEFREAVEGVAKMGEAGDAPRAAVDASGDPSLVGNAEGVKSPSDAKIVAEQVRKQDAQPSSPLTPMSKEEQLNLQKLAKAINSGMIDVGGVGGSTGMTVEESVKALKLDRVFFGQKYLDANGQVIASEKDAATVLAQAMQGAKGAETVPQALTLQQGIEQAQKMFNLDNRSLGQLLGTLAEKQIDIRTYLTASKFIEDLRAKTVAEKIREFNGLQAEVERLRAAGDAAGAAEVEKKAIGAARQSVEAGLNIDKLAQANAKLASEVGRTLNILNMKPGQVKAKLAELSDLHQSELGTKRLELLKPSELRTELERLNLVAEFGPDALRAYEQTFKGSGRFAKAAYESWIQSLLWAPKSWVSNGTAIFQAVFKPLESSLGHALTGNFDDASHALTLSYKWASYLGESWWLAQKAFKQERPVLGSKAFTDTPGEIGAINAQFLGIDHPIAAGMVNGYGRVMRTPSRVMLFTDELIKQAVARSYAEQAFLKQGLERVKLGTMDASQLKNYVESSMNDLFLKNGRLYSEQAVRDAAITEATSRGLKPQDAEFKKFVAGYVEKNFNQNLGAVSDKARGYAEEITWQKELGNEGGIERLGNWINSGKNNLPILKLIFPFVRTPANLMIWVKDRSPLGIPKMWKDFSSGNPMRRAEAVGRLTSMAGFMTVAMTATAAGNITGRGPSDPEQRRALMDTGWQPYSVKVGDTYVSYLRADPFSTLMGIVADLTDAAHNTYNESQLSGDTQRIMAGLLSSMSRSVTEKTFMAGLSLWSDVLSGEPNAAAKLFRNYAGSAIPFSGLMNSVVPQFDDEMKQLRSMTDAVMAKVPGLSNQVEPYRNLFGEALKKPIAYTGMFGGVVDPANPFPVTWASGDPVKGEIARLNYGFNQPTPTLRNGQIDLRELRNAKGQSAYDRWQELHGQIKVNGKGLYDSLSQLIKSKSYQRLPAEVDNRADSPRVEAIRSIVTRYRKRAQEQMLREFPQVADALQRSVQNEYRMKIGLTPQ